MNSYLQFPKKEACCGCGLCASKCPAHCIQMCEDEEGFFYPVINKEKCLKCDLCSKVCPFEIQTKHPKESIHAYAAHSEDSEILRNSSSGGIFSEIAIRFLQNGGCVCGATIDRNHKVFHVVVESVDDLPLLQGSKYVQSRLEVATERIGDLLKRGKRVLFCGTPCQVAAVKNAFHSDLLYTIDVLCHGVPSQKLFDNYISYLEEKHKGTLTDIWFRDKDKNGWSITQKYSIQKNGRTKLYYLDRHLSEYFSGFLRNMTQRESCYHCPFTTVERCGDVTLADFWGIEKTHPELYYDKGTSLVFVNNERGDELLSCCNNVVLNHVSISDALVQNPNFQKPPERDSKRDCVYRDVYRDGFALIGKRYILPSNAYKYRIAAILGVNPAQMKRRK